ncbi:MAG: response regulator transcription factor [Verrucomicrobia bacterium]|nr:response regulator transcription factor [Verrucomicrobiota bacterium]
MSPPTIPTATVALIEDDASYCRALARCFGPRCVGAWETVEAALPELAVAAPAVLLLDIDLPGLPGHAAVPRLLAATPATHIVMLTAHDRDDLVFAALQAGAIGYLLKTAAPDEILAAVATAMAGGSPMSPAIARKIVGFFAAKKLPPPAAPVRDLALAALTEREAALLALIADGASDKTAADQLGLTHGSVRNRLQLIYRKLHVTSRTAAALRWRNH